VEKDRRCENRRALLVCPKVIGHLVHAAEKAPIATIIVDSVEKNPSEN